VTISDIAEEQRLAHNRRVNEQRMNASPWLVWSNQRGMWWRANHSGYTQFIEEAGRYSRVEAEQIVRQATCDGLLKKDRVNPITGETYASYDEHLVAAPEHAGD
jgi:hypothetical protein